MLKHSYKNLPHCGDDHALWEYDGKKILCIVDGLGHGEQAQIAAKAAVHYVESHLSEPLSEIFAGCDEEIARTRGVAMGIAVIDEQKGTLTYGGVGNIVARIIGHEPRSGELMRFTGNAGIIGGGYKRFNEGTEEITPGQLFLMHTDGMTTRIDLSKYTRELYKDLDKLAETVLEDWGKETDDRALVLYRYDGP